MWTPSCGDEGSDSTGSRGKIGYSRNMHLCIRGRDRSRQTGVGRHPLFCAGCLHHSDQPVSVERAWRSEGSGAGKRSGASRRTAAGNRRWAQRGWAAIRRIGRQPSGSPAACGNRSGHRLPDVRIRRSCAIQKGGVVLSADIACGGVSIAVSAQDVPLFSLPSRF